MRGHGGGGNRDCTGPANFVYNKVEFVYHEILMEIVNRVARMAALTTKTIASDVKIGLVPTMGAIHPGHLSLIQTARNMTDLVVVAIFVNRLQFITDEEYQNYPRDITKDVDLLRHEDVDYIFTPPEEEMYPQDFSTYVTVGSFGDKLSGLPRTAYFKGMTTSVLKLVQIVRPSFIFFGQKDGLPGAILRKMVRDLNINTEVVVTPVVRDASGLAYATRNYFLTEPQKKAASVIYRSLRAAETIIAGGEMRAQKIISEIGRIIESEPQAKLEYAIVADPVSLEPINKIQKSALIAVGAMIGNTSLNDSTIFEKKPVS
jgi:pantoate--beta-alanine ligase